MHNNRIFITFAVCMSLFAPLVAAQELNIPDKAHRQGMTYEEYAALREKMRARMENMTPTERQQLRETMRNARGERREANRTYGEGYQARRRNMEKAEIRPDRPEKPQRPERPERPEMPQRFQRP